MGSRQKSRIGGRTGRRMGHDSETRAAPVDLYIMHGTSGGAAPSAS